MYAWVSCKSRCYYYLRGIVFKLMLSPSIYHKYNFEESFFNFSVLNSKDQVKQRLFVCIVFFRSTLLSEL